jgi:hypothetical protein
MNKRPARRFYKSIAFTVTWRKADMDILSIKGPGENFHCPFQGIDKLVAISKSRIACAG